MKKKSKKGQSKKKKPSSVTLDKGHEKERNVFYDLIDADGDIETAVKSLKQVYSTQVSQ